MLHRFSDKLKTLMKTRKLGSRRTTMQRAAAAAVDVADDDDIAADPTARSWADLPPELLSLISDRLGMIQLLAFRGVCKSWRSASSTASADCESELKTKPSFIVYEEGGGGNKCSLYYRTDSKDPDGEIKVYGVNIPELENGTCLASNHGWLLIHQHGSMFFFCPFSRARIDLPEFPESELSNHNHVAAFSAPPTCKKCIVSVANRWNHLNFKLYVLSRGDREWALYERHYPAGFRSSISAALFVEEKSSFYFMGDNKSVLKFSVKEKTWNDYYVVTVTVRHNESLEFLPFGFVEKYFNHCDMKKWMKLEGDVSISTCGTLLPGRKRVTYACNEKLAGAEDSKLRGIWLQARFIQLEENQGWDL